MAADTTTTAALTSWATPIRPGDTLVIGFTGRVSQVEAKRVRDRFQEVAPDVTVIVLDDVSALAVCRQGAP
jgi:hypothetical protein